MVLLQDQEMRLKKQAETKSQPASRSSEIAGGFLFATIIGVGLLFLFVVFSVFPNSGSTALSSTGGFFSRIASRITDLLNADRTPATDVTNSAVNAAQGTVTAGSFQLLATPDIKTSPDNNDASYTVRLVRGEGFTDAVALTVTGLPAKTTATIEPTSLSGSDEAVVTVHIEKDAARGDYAFSIVGTAGTLSRKVTTNLGISDVELTKQPTVTFAQMPTGPKWQARIQWSTNIESTSWVEYAPEASYIADGLTYRFSSIDRVAVTDHDITLLYLEPKTTYHLRVRSVDKNNSFMVGDDLTLTTE